MFSCEIGKIFKNTFSEEHLRRSASDSVKKELISQFVDCWKLFPAYNNKTIFASHHTDFKFWYGVLLSKTDYKYQQQKPVLICNWKFIITEVLFIKFWISTIWEIIQKWGGENTYFFQRYSLSIVCSEAVVQRCSVKKIFLKNLLKKRLRHRFFSVNFVKFLRTSISIERLWWLVLHGYWRSGENIV